MFQAAVELLDRVHAAMLPLQAYNPDMNLMRGRATQGYELHVPSRNMQPVHTINMTMEDQAANNSAVVDEETESINNNNTNNNNSNFDGEEVVDDVDDDDRDTIALRGEYLLIDLGPVHGQYTLQADDHQSSNILVQMQSPLSGVIPYRYNVSTREWRSVVDNHHLVGMLVRDLIRQIQGVPNL